jgi:hypothetical protein
VDIIRRNESPLATDEKLRGLPGCGLAAYTLLLLLLCIVGMAGMAGGFIGVLFQGEGKGPLPLQPGTQTAVWALAPMREAKVLRVDEIPLAFHSEARDASVACAMMDDRLIRVDEGVGSILLYAAITEITTEGTEDIGMTITSTGTAETGPVAIPCIFNNNEGGDKFERMLRAEHGKATAG